ncbi:hypothetical protein LTR86_009145 [Recurvomyces mirabilis]|nr:hypothetical protein LTR86_009145 [Recurvomyces mirabilis]
MAEHPSLVKHTYNVAGHLFWDLYQHASVLDGRRRRSPISMAILKVWNPAKVVMSILCCWIVDLQWPLTSLKGLAMGARLLTLTMVEMPATVLYKSAEQVSPLPISTKDVERVKQVHANQAASERPSLVSDDMMSAVPVLPHFWLLAFTSNTITAMLKDTTTSGFTYVSAIISLLLSVDALFGLQGPLARSGLFISLSMLLAPLHMLWTHCLITPATGPSISERMKTMRLFYRPLAVPALLYATAQAVTVAYPIHMIQHLFDKERHWDLVSASRVLAIPSTAAVLHICLLLPTGIVLSRVEAALLPQEENMVVPFEALRIISSGGKFSETSFVVPYFHALRSMDFQLWRRVVKHSFLWMGGLALAWGVRDFL